MFELLKGLASMLKNSFVGWVKDAQAVKYFGVLALIYIVTSVLTLLLMGSTMGPLYQNPDNIALLFASLGSMFLVLILITFLQILIVFILQYFILARALSLKKLPSVPFSVSRLVNFIILEVAIFFTALLSLFKLRMLLIGIGAIVALILAIIFFALKGVFAIIGILLLIAAGLLGAVYLLIVVYNSYRLSMSIPIYIEKKQSIRLTLRESWNITRGNVISIFVAYLLIGIILWLIESIVGVPALMYSLPASISGTATQFTLMTNPLYIALLIPTYIAQAYIFVVTAFFMIELYSRLRGTVAKAKSAVSSRAVVKKAAKKKVTRRK